LSNVFFNDAAAATFTVPDSADAPDDAGAADGEASDDDGVSAAPGDEFELEEQPDTSTAPATSVPKKAALARRRFTSDLSGFPR
jgi:hypothetical protein